MEDRNKYIDSFEIFQERDEECNSIIQEAEKIKKEIQDELGSIDVITSNNKKNYLFNIFDYDIKIDKFSDSVSNLNPLTPKLYTCIYNPSYYLYKYKWSKNEPEEDNRKDLHDNLNEEKKNVIKNYVYDTFVGNSISKDYFENFAKQNFLLNLVKKHFEDTSNNLEDLIKNEVDGINIFFLNCKLFPPIIKKDTNIYHLSNAVLEIDNSYKFLQSKNSILVGSFSYYQEENELITQLSKMQNHRWDKISDFYPNDFIFLNNSEFIDDNVNTSDWERNNIFPPFLVNTDRKIPEITIQNEVFFYNKNKEDGSFYKTELFMPENLRKEGLLNILAKLLNHHSSLKSADTKIDNYGS